MDGLPVARQCFCKGVCVAGEAIKLANAGDLEKAYPEARRAVLKAPNCPFTHGALGFIMNNNGLSVFAEKQIHIAKLLGDNPSVADTQLGFSFIAQGKMIAAENAFIAALTANPNHGPAHIGLATVYEKNGERERALSVAEQIMVPGIDIPGLKALLTKIYYGLGRYDDALKLLDDAADSPLLFERGKIKEKLGYYVDAFSDYTRANQLTGKSYEREKALSRINNHKLFTSKRNLSRLPRLDGDGMLKPIFICGYPRSGTTLTETILSNHSDIHAGDELPFLSQLAGMAKGWLTADEDYPFALNELIIGDKTAVLHAMRTFYITKALRSHDMTKGFITDKMPLNEMHLPFMSLLFPNAPILYVRRHPLDIIFSNFATFLTHGFNQSFSVETSAEHYALVDDLVLHYKAKVDMRYADIRYEDMIAQPDVEIRDMLDFVGVPFEDACLSPETNRNAPRTPSYEAVSRPINDSSVGRWKKFAPYMGEAMRIVEPIMIREGY